MFIRRDEAIKSIDDYAQALYSHNDWKMGETADHCATLLENVPDEYVVSKAEYDYIKKDRDTLRKLVAGEWVDCEAVQRALDITFSQGLKMFDFGRQVAWNKFPKNGQYIVTKFRLDPEKIPDKYSVQFWTEDDDTAYDDFNSTQSGLDVKELILEQQGGII